RDLRKFQRALNSTDLLAAVAAEQLGNCPPTGKRGVHFGGRLSHWLEPEVPTAAPLRNRARLPAHLIRRGRKHPPETAGVSVSNAAGNIRLRKEEKPSPNRRCRSWRTQPGRRRDHRERRSGAGVFWLRLPPRGRWRRASG